MKTLICGIGSRLRADDGIGPFVIDILHKEALGFDVILLDCGNAPESFLGRIEQEKPERIIIIDAVELGRPPGTVQLIDTGSITGDAHSTHKLPLGIFLHYLKPLGADIVFIGVQPKSIAVGGKMSNECMPAVAKIKRIVSGLCRGS